MKKLRTVRVKTSELSGEALDYAVAKSLGWVNYPTDSVEQGGTWHTDPIQAPFGPTVLCCDFRPSTNWAQGGELIDSEGVSTRKEPDGWYATIGETGPAAFASCAGHCFDGGGPTPLIAACRCIVAMYLGDEAEIPDNLIDTGGKA